MDEWATVQQALVITVIGVGLIFAVLFVLWGLMAALVRFTAPRAQVAPPPAAAPAQYEAADALHAARRHAAIVGVAVALALEAERAATAPLLQPAQGAISPWQATIRGNALSRRAGAFQRTPPPSR
jgi:Na+-transporting methylmalonyl-CoA/oxaloacetate decarboxylase gamma subunit